MNSPFEITNHMLDLLVSFTRLKAIAKPVPCTDWFCDCCAAERGGAAFRQAPSPQRTE
jgi:hypothetical protein